MHKNVKQTYESDHIVSTPLRVQQPHEDEQIANV